VTLGLLIAAFLAGLCAGVVLAFLFVAYFVIPAPSIR